MVGTQPTVHQYGKLRLFLSAIDRISEVTGKVVSLLIFPLILIVVQEVIRRYFFKAPTSVSYELSTFIYAAHFLLGAPFVLLIGGHMKIDLFSGRLSPRVMAGLDAVLYIFLFFFYIAALLWVTSIMAFDSWTIRETTGSVWDPPYYIIKAVVPLSVFLLMLQGIADFIRKAIFAIKGVKA